jgi:predicted DNA-binding transcriptional regulator AlpA
VSEPLESAKIDRIVTTRQAAEILGYAHPDSLRKAIRSGRLPQPIKLGPTRHVYRLSDLEAYIANLKPAGEGGGCA